MRPEHSNSLDILTSNAGHYFGVGSGDYGVYEHDKVKFKSQTFVQLELSLQVACCLCSTPTQNNKPSLEGVSLSSIQEMNAQSVSQGGVQAHLYTG